MVHYVNPANHAPGVQIGRHNTRGGGGDFSHRLIKKSSETIKSTAKVSGWYRLIKPLVGSPKHFVLKVSCSDNLKSVMCCLAVFRA